jgi:hypothetical protein
MFYGLREDARNVITIQKALISGTLDDLQRKVEELARDQGPYEYMAGTRLRELAVALAMHDDLRVSVVTYENGSQELEVVLTGDPHCDAVMIDRNKLGDQCQVTWERWLAINDAPSTHIAVGLIKAVLKAGGRPTATNSKRDLGYEGLDGRQ